MSEDQNTEKSLRSEIERLLAENKSLRERVETLEFQLERKEQADRNYDSRERGRYS